MISHTHHTNIYVESSAIVSWLLDEADALIVRTELGRATRVMTSALTSLECSHAFHRAIVDGRMSPTQALAARSLLDRFEQTWEVHDINAAVLERAKQRVPGAPIRTLDAIHVATCGLISDALGPITMLSLDRRVRETAARTGITLLPADR